MWRRENTGCSSVGLVKVSNPEPQCRRRWGLPCPHHTYRPQPTLGSCSLTPTSAFSSPARQTRRPKKWTTFPLSWPSTNSLPCCLFEYFNHRQTCQLVNHGPDIPYNHIKYQRSTILKINFQRRSDCHPCEMTGVAQCLPQCLKLFAGGI